MNDVTDYQKWSAKHLREDLASCLGENVDEYHISDLICDLHHLSDTLGLDWYHAIQIADMHHAFESDPANNEELEAAADGYK